MEQQLLINKREAALLGAKISFALIAVALVMAICYTIGLCNMSQLKNVFFSNTFFVSSYNCLIVSIYEGGKGINQIRTEGFQNKWDVKTGSSCFNMQAFFMILSVVLFFIGFVIKVS